MRTGSDVRDLRPPKVVTATARKDCSSSAETTNPTSVPSFLWHHHRPNRDLERAVLTAEPRITSWPPGHSCKGLRWLITAESQGA
jgi:hypothetical protein